MTLITESLSLSYIGSQPLEFISYQSMLSKSSLFLDFVNILRILGLMIVIMIVLFIAEVFYGYVFNDYF